MNPREISELVFLVEKENNLFFKSSGVENINSEIDKNYRLIRTRHE